MFETPTARAQGIITVETMQADIASMMEASTPIRADDNLVELGLDSMQVMRLVNRWRRAGLHVNFADLMENPTLAAWQKLAQSLEWTPTSTRGNAKRAEVNVPFGLSDVQYAYWIGRRAGQSMGDIACHALLEIDGRNVDPARLQAAWLTVQERHSMLRARFLESGEQEIMAQPFSSAIPVHDLRACSEAECQHALTNTFTRLSHRKLLVEQGEVAGLELSLLPGGKTRMHFDLDLLVADVQSLHIILRDLARAYAGKTLTAPEAWSFAHYLAQMADFRLPLMTVAQDYWQKRLPELPGAPALPLITAPEKLCAPHFSRRTHRLWSSEFRRLQEQAARRRVTPAMVFLAAYAEVLARWSANPHFLINIPLFDRQEQDGALADVVADFTNLVLLEVDCCQDMGFAQRVQTIQAQLHRDLAHSAYSGVQVQRDLARLRGGGMAAPVVFASNLGMPLLDLDCREQFGNLHSMISQTPQVWLDFQLYEDDDGLLLAWDAVDALFPAGLIDTMFAALVRLLSWLTGIDSNWDLVVPEMLPEEQKQRRFLSSRYTLSEPPQCLHLPFLNQAAREPGRVALLDGATGSQITYSGLAERALSIAAFLQARGVESGEPVALTLPRGMDQIAGVLGILACGACYVPISLHQPAARRTRIYQLAGIRHVLTSATVLQEESWPDHVQVLEIEDSACVAPLLHPIFVPPIQTAYIIFTSGSTGEPKGVEIAHGAAWNTIAAVNRRCGVDANDRLLAVSALDFDLSVYDIFGLLAAGGCVVLLPESARREAAFWLELVGRHRITVWNSVPVLFEMLLVLAENNPGQTLPLRRVMLSGDWIPLDLPDRLARLAPDCVLTALGGATEASIWSNAFEVTLPLPKEWLSIPYGNPLPGQAFRVVDARGRDCPDWVAGEFWIGGAGVALGYRGQPELTAERFVRWHDAVWYRTGDRGRWWPDDTLEFLGREDLQIKIRGHRIELGEIESLMQRHPGVRDAVAAAVCESSGEKRLVAWVVPEEGDTDAPLWDIEKADEKSRYDLKHALQILQRKETAICAPAASFFRDFAEKLVAVAICRIFREIGLFAVPERKINTATLSEAGIKAGYLPLATQWLDVLVEEGMLERDRTGAFALAPGASVNIERVLLPVELADQPAWQESREKLQAYLERAGSHFARLLRGEVDPLVFYFSEHPELAPEHLLNLLPGTNHITELLVDIVHILQEHRQPSSRLRFLEVGGRSGSVTQIILSALTPEDVDYTCTDSSTFFTSRQEERFRGYSFVNARVLDMDRDPLAQGFVSHSYDVIIASNALHRAHDLAATLQYLRSLLAPAGVLIVLELTEATRLALVSAGLLDATGTLPALLSPRKWQRLLHEAGFTNITIFPADDAAGAACFSRCIFLAQAPDNVRRFNAAGLQEWLQRQLPEYMLPALYLPLHSLPLTANGKVDRKCLPRPEMQMGKDREALANPRTPLEQSLVHIWQQVLQLPRVGIDESFLQLGGDSLLAVQLTARIRTELQRTVPLERLFAVQTIAGLAEFLEGQTADSAALTDAHVWPQIVPDNQHQHEPFPLTAVQQAYWVGRTGAYELGQVAAHCYFELDAEMLDLKRAETAWQRLIQQHGMMRAVVLPDGRQQILQDVEPYHIRIMDLSHVDAKTAEQELLRLREELSHEVMPSGQWPLFDVRATRLQGDRVRLHIGFDNLIFDGWSMFHLLREWRRLYDEPAAALPELKLSFRDYVLACESLGQSEKAEQDRIYWLDRLSDLPPAPELPLAGNPADLGVQRFRRLEARLDAKSWQDLQSHAKAAGLTLSGVLLAAYAEVLAFWSKSPRFTLNLTQFDRLPLHSQVRDMVGDFTSLTLLAVDNHQGDTFLARAQAMQRQLWQDLDHSLMNGVAVQRELSRQRQEYGGASMPIVFTSALGVDQVAGSLSGDRWLGRLVYNISQTPQVWLDHQAYEQEGELELVWDAVAGLFPENLLEDMFAAYLHILRQLVADEVAWQTKRFDFLPNAQHQRRERLNATTALPPDTPELLHELFARQVATLPDAPALIFSGGSLTYRQTARRAHRLSLLLREQGLKANMLCAVAMDKGWEQAVAVLGILEAGGAWLPVDPAQPASRLHHMLYEGMVRTILTQSWLVRAVDWPQDMTVIAVDELEESENDVPLSLCQTSEDLAYVIYTSGSTGLPKGVAISHRAAVNTIVDINRRFHVGLEDRMLALASLSFDLSVYDFFGALAAGGGIVFPRREAVKEPAHWAELVRHFGVTVWNSVPAMMQMLVAHAGLNDLYPSLRLILLSGDWIPLDMPDKVRRLTAGGNVMALGGATEAAIWSNCASTESIPSGCRSIPYGRPLTNQRLYVLDSAMQLRPDWTAGQLYIGGLGLALGYWQDADKTAAAFVRHPENGERLYKTGDLGRYLPDGQIEFLGREDTQVKINGYRVELGEVEAAACSHPAVREAVALVTSERQVRLFVVLNPQDHSLSRPYACNGEQAAADWRAAETAADRAVSELAVSVGVDELADLSRWVQQDMWQIEQEALHLMRRVLRSLGLFTPESSPSSLSALAQQAGIPARHLDVFRLWLETLVGAHWLVEANGSFAVGGRWTEAKVEQADADAMVAGVRIWLARLEPFCVPLLTGRLQATDVFFAEDSDLAPESLARLLPAANLAGEAVRALMPALTQRAGAEGQPLRVLFLGVRVPEAVQEWLSLLSGQVRCTFGVSSLFFAKRLSQVAGDIEVRLYDMDLEPLLQGWEPQSFDLVVADQAVHRSRNLHTALIHARSLLKPGGLLLMREGTASSALVQLSAAFLEAGFSGLDDERAVEMQPFVAEQSWVSALRQAGFVRISQPFAAAGLTEAAGQTLLLAQTPECLQKFAPEQLQIFLAEKLPVYMRPTECVPLVTLPLTANGKLDRKALSMRPKMPADATPLSAAPVTETERRLMGIWQEVLQTGQPDLDANFFELGGDSLLATRIVVRVRDEFGIEVPLRTLFARPTLRELANCLETRTTGQEAAIVELPQIVPDPSRADEAFPLTAVQQAYVAGRSGLYPLGRVAAHCYFEYDAKDLDVARAEAAWQRLVQHHGMLRAIFLENGACQQILQKTPAWRLKCVDLHASSPEDVEAALARTRDEMAHQVLFLEHWPLFDLRVSQYGEGHSRIHISLDNLVVDGWSMFRVLSDWSRLYTDLETPLPDISLSFRDYVLGEGRIRESASYQRDKEYWLKRMDSLPPAPTLPLVRKPLAGETYRFSRLQKTLSAEQWSALKERAQSVGVSPSGMLLAAYAEVLGRWSGQQRFTINLTQFNRLPVHPQIGDIAGDFTSLILLAVERRGRCFIDRVRDLQNQLWSDLDHTTFSGVELLREMGATRGESGSTVMPFVFTSALGLNPNDEKAMIGSSLGEFVYGISQTPQVLLDHQAFELAGQLLLVWDLAWEYFPAGMPEDMFASYVHLLIRLSEDATLWDSSCVLPLPPVQAESRRTVNATECDFDGPQLLQELFLAQATCHPDRLAVLAGDRQMSYRELAARSASLAHNLRSAGVQPGELVAIVMEKGWEQVVAVLGILMSGGAYLPLAADIPPERLSHVLKDSQVRLACIQERCRLVHNWPEQLRLYSVDDPTNESWLDVQPPEPVQTPDDLSYVIYTSGSTGQPKGVAISHRAVVNTIRDINERFGVGPEDKFFALSALHFDLSVYDIFGALAVGATIVLPDPAGLKDPAHWLTCMQRHGVTVWNSVPALMQMLVQHMRPRQGKTQVNLRLALLSGDWVPPELPTAVRAMCPRVSVISLGGATEAAIWSICFPVPRDYPSGQAIPYGRPLANQRFYVLNADFEDCPDWVPGMLYIAGSGLAMGYWGDTEKTDASFLRHPQTGERLYKTGDLGRYLPDGSIAFLGRDDGQVKIRGYRIELGEVEAALKALPLVADAAVLRVETQGNPKLVAWLVVAGTDKPETASVKEALRSRLPDYMIPELLVFLPELPLTANGKVDRNALFLPEEIPEEASVPLSHSEQVVAELWALVLKRSVTDRAAGFFAVGGDSLAAVELTNAFFKKFQVELPLSELFRDPTVAGMAQALDTARAADGAGKEATMDLPQVQPAPADRFEPFPLTEVQQAYWLGRSSAYELGHVATHTYFEIETELDLPRLEAAWLKVLARHEMLRAVLLPDGTQHILKSVPAYYFAVQDLRALPSAAREEALLRWRQEMEPLMHPVDRWPLFAIRASRIGDRTSRLHLSFDALILDGWSMGIIFRDWNQFYHEPKAVLPSLELSYRDYVLASAAFRATPQYQRDQAFQLARLNSLPPAPPLPMRKTFAQIEQPRFCRLSRRFPKETLQILQRRAAEHQLTLAAVLLTAYAAVLSRWSGVTNLTINVSFFNRLPLHPQVMDIVGDFTSVQLLPVVLAEQDGFVQQARVIQQELWQGLDHRTFSGVSVLRELAKRRGTPQAAIMPVVFTSFLGMEQSDEGDNQAIGLLGRMSHNVSQTPQVALDSQAGIFAGELGLNWDVVAELFPAGLIEDMFAAYCRLVTDLAAADADWNRTFAVILPAEQQERRLSVNATAAPVPPGLLHEPFLRQARANPEALAIIDCRRSLSYGELASVACRTAALLHQHGLQTGDRVAVLMDKGWEQIAAVLGILIAGAVYLPLAPDTPEKRLAFIFADAGIRFALTQSWLQDQIVWPEGVLSLSIEIQIQGDADIDIWPEPMQRPDALAYLIYTSGSTGQPKGVMIDHRGALNTVAAVNRCWKIQATDHIFGLSQLHFDLSVYDIFGTLSAGAALVLPHPEHGRDPEHWLNLMQRHHVTVWNSVPALMQMLIAFVQGQADALLSDLRLTLLSGDWLPVDLPAKIRTLAPHAQIVSLGGATEASIWSIAWPVDRDTTELASIPYGFPLANQNWHVLDAALRDCPDWTTGELVIGGIGLAHGYWRDPEKTASAFFLHPHSGERLYRTGDLGRYLPDGTIEFRGRKDFQLKINGFRIEPGEIEAACKRHPGVADALVMGQERGRNQEKGLVAWVEPRAGQHLDKEELAVFVRRFLPAYMMPEDWVFLDAFPLNANGKVDRQSLPRPQGQETEISTCRPMRPLSVMERKIAGVVGEALGLEEVNPSEQFFTLGANSLDIVRMQNRLAGLLEQPVSVVDFFTHPTVEQLAALLQTGSEQKTAPEACARDRRHVKARQRHVRK